MTTSTTPPSHGLLVLMTAALFGALLPSGGYAQDAQNLRTVIIQDPELQSIRSALSSSCLSDDRIVAEIARNFSAATGVELSEFAATVSSRNSEDPDVWRGDYEDYSFLSRVRVATAPLIDPDLLPRVGTANAFPLTEVLASDEVDHRQLTAQVIGGSVGVAERHNGSYPIVLPGSENWRRAVNVMQESDIDLHADLAEWLLITRDDTFPGVNSSASVMIAWDTDMPLSTVLLETYRAALLQSLEAAAATCEDHQILQAILDYYGARPGPR